MILLNKALSHINLKSQRITFASFLISGSRVNGKAHFHLQKARPNSFKI